MRNFADRLLDEIDKVDAPVCVGLDPNLDDIPQFIKDQAMKEFDVKPGEVSENAFFATQRTLEIFNQLIIDETMDLVPAYKPQIAYYERYGPAGLAAFRNTLQYVMSRGRIAIDDSKRSDIDRTARAYAEGHLGVVELVTGGKTVLFDADAMTIMPYFGTDGINPFLEECKRFGKGVFIVAKTSNPSHVELQALELAAKHGGRKLYEEVAVRAELIGRHFIGERGYSSVGIVVGASGATPEEIRAESAAIRSLNPYALKLAPGYGTQGAMGRDVVPSFNGEGYGAIVSSASGIIFAYKKEPYNKKFKPEEFDKAARASVLTMRDDVRTALKEAGFRRWL